MIFERASLKHRAGSGTTSTRLSPSAADSGLWVSGRAASYNTLAPADFRLRSTGKAVFTKFAPGCFKAGEIDVLCIFGTETSGLVGRTRTGTLKLKSNTSGLDFECLLPNSSFGRDVFGLIRRGDVNCVSIAYSILDYQVGTGNSWTITAAELRRVELFGLGGKPNEGHGLVVAGRLDAAAVSRRMAQRITLRSLRQQIANLDQRLKAGRR